MDFVRNDGAPVCPGDVLFMTASVATPCDVVGGVGALAQHRMQHSPPSSESGLAAKKLRAEHSLRETMCVVATRRGIVQWKDNVVTVLPAQRVGEINLRAAPTPSAKVHMRVQRVGLSHVVGEIFAIDGKWCLSGTFRGSLRQEDIRPPLPRSTELVPCAVSMRPGDVVLAQCISQADARLYELSTLGEGLGVVEAVGTSERGARMPLRPIPGRRDAMLNPSTGREESRWTPL